MQHGVLIAEDQDAVVVRVVGQADRMWDRSATLSFVHAVGQNVTTKSNTTTC